MAGPTSVGSTTRAAVALSGGFMEELYLLGPLSHPPTVDPKQAYTWSHENKIYSQNGTRETRREDGWKYAGGGPWVKERVAALSR